jgi:hypothetical protein
MAIFFAQALAALMVGQSRFMAGDRWSRMSGRPGETNLAVFTVCKQATPTSLRSSPQIDVLDEHGRKLGTAFAGPTSGNSDGKHSRQLVCWILDSDIPHDASRLVLRFSEVTTNSGSRQQVAEFVIPNPAASDHN